MCPSVVVWLGAWILMDQACEQQAGRFLFPFLPADSRAQALGCEWGVPLLGRVQQLPFLSSSSAWKRGQKDPFSCLLLAASVRDKN